MNLIDKSHEQHYKLASKIHEFAIELGKEMVLTKYQFHTMSFIIDNQEFSIRYKPSNYGTGVYIRRVDYI